MADEEEKEEGEGEARKEGIFVALDWISSVEGASAWFKGRKKRANSAFRTSKLHHRLKGELVFWPVDCTKSKLTDAAGMKLQVQKVKVQVRLLRAW